MRNMSEIFTPTPDSQAVTPTLINGHKIDICHVPPGNPENAHVIEVDIHAWENGHTPHNAHNMDFIVDGEHECPPQAEVTPTPTRTPTMATETKTGTPSSQTPTPESARQLPISGGGEEKIDLTPLGLTLLGGAAAYNIVKWWDGRVRRVQAEKNK